MFYEFMTNKSWTANTTGLIWMLAFILVVMWFACLKKDLKWTQHLEKNWRGKLAIVVMPFLFMMMSWSFIDKSLPLFLHMISVQQEVRYDMDYRKRSGRKYCRERLEIIETEELEDGDLCLTESQRNRLPEKGKITVVGIRSQFGIVINGFNLP
jgi:amino acid transporter